MKKALDFISQNRSPSKSINGSGVKSIDSPDRKKIVQTEQMRKKSDMSINDDADDVNDFKNEAVFSKTA